jgi:hypothetical protein
MVFPVSSMADQIEVPSNIKYIIKHNFIHFNSIYVDYTQTSYFTEYYYTSMNENPKDHPKVQSFRSIYAVDGNKLFDKEIISNYPNVINKIWIINKEQYSQIKSNVNRKSYSDIPYTQTELTKTYVPLNRITLYNTPPQLETMMFDGQWLTDAFQLGKTQLTKVVQNSQLGPLYVITMQSPPGTIDDKQIKAQFWLAKKYGFMVVKSIIERQYSNTDKNIYINKFNNWTKHGLIWFPNDSTTEEWVVKHGSSNYLIRISSHLNDLKVNDVPLNIFNVNLPPNSILDNQITGTRYRIGANGKWIPVETNSPPSPTLPQRMPHWLFLISLFVMILIGLDAFQRWFRKRSRSS